MAATTSALSSCVQVGGGPSAGSQADATTKRMLLLVAATRLSRNGSTSGGYPPSAMRMTAGDFAMAASTPSVSALVVTPPPQSTLIGTSAALNATPRSPVPVSFPTAMPAS